MAESATNRPGRLQFLDALRGLAVLLVLAQHVGQALFTPFVSFVSNDVQLGQFGVMVFFLCSGYIIPATLERRDSLGDFWISRFFRLYPMYWISLLAVAIGIACGVTLPSIRLHEWLSNITMLQIYLGGGNVLGPYWTLGWEMTFYIIMSGLFLLSLNKRTLILSISASGVILLGVLASSLTSHNVPLGAFNLSTMFLGTLVYRVHSGELTWRQTSVAFCAAGVAGIVLLLKVLGHAVGPAAFGDRRFVPMLSAWVGAYGVFLLGSWWWRNHSAPRPLTAIGRWSYSIYLWQGFVIAVIRRGHHPHWLVASEWVLVTIALSIISYTFLENPATCLGRFLMSRRHQGKTAVQ
jgi:peptidoglycan/LPS O-acetylase OafA/YrhL